MLELGGDDSGAGIPDSADVDPLLVVLVPPIQSHVRCIREGGFTQVDRQFHRHLELRAVRAERDLRGTARLIRHRVDRATRKRAYRDLQSIDIPFEHGGLGWKDDLDDRAHDSQ